MLMVAAALTVALGAGPLAQGRGAPPPMTVDFADHAGFEQIFDGRTLDGWDGAPEIWRVEDGAIVAEATPENPAGTTFLIWRGGEPADFELKLEIRLEGDGGNSGIQYRSRQAVPDANFGGGRGGRGGGPVGGPYNAWNLQGYQADFNGPGTMAGQLFEGGRFAGERGITTRPGQAILLREGQGPMLVAEVGSPERRAASFREGDWNQYHIVVRGNTFLHILNGELASVTVDDDPTRYVDRGLVGLQIEGGDLKVSFRDIWIKTLR